MAKALLTLEIEAKREQQCCGKTPSWFATFMQSQSEVNLRYGKKVFSKVAIAA